MSLSELPVNLFLGVSQGKEIQHPVGEFGGPDVLRGQTKLDLKKKVAGA